jgi:hypothetical protein
MARVKLLFEDTPDGLVEFRADYSGGFEATSHAHLMANQVIKFLDEHASKKLEIGEPHGHA